MTTSGTSTATELEPTAGTSAATPESRSAVRGRHASGSVGLRRAPASPRAPRSRSPAPPMGSLVRAAGHSRVPAARRQLCRRCASVPRPRAGSRVRAPARQAGGGSRPAIATSAARAGDADRSRSGSRRAGKAAAAQARQARVRTALAFTPVGGAPRSPSSGADAGARERYRPRSGEGRHLGPARTNDARYLADAPVGTRPCLPTCASPPDHAQLAITRPARRLTTIRPLGDEVP